MSGELLGRDTLVKNMSSFEAKFVEKLVRAVEVTQALISNFAKQNHPYKDRTGQLTNSIQPSEVTVTETMVEGAILADKDYASYVELGTSKSHPYPFLFPALASQQESFRIRVKNAFSEAS